MKKVLILGNAQDRLNQTKFISEWKDEIWCCNKAYLEINQYPNISLVASVHDFMAKEAVDYKKKNNLTYRVVCSKKVLEAELFIKYRGWSTGTELIQQAIIAKYDEIWIAGFEFVKGNDIYQPNKVYCGNFEKQFVQIKQENPNAKIIWAPFDDPTKDLRKEPLRRISQEEKIFTPSIDNNRHIFEKFKEYLSEKNDVIIIGNSPLVLDKELGNAIDKFSYVVRINDYKINQYEKYIGSKTTFWATGASYSTKVKNRNVENIIPLVFIPIQRFEKDKCLSESIEKNLEVPFDKLVIIDKSDISAINKYANIDYLSTGLMTILYFSMILQMDVTIHGFHAYQKNQGHYYDNEPAYISPMHEFEKEFEFIDNLVNTGKIKRLG